MGVKDKVGSTVKIKQSTTFDIKELYKNLKKWVKERGYKISEPNYAEKPSADGAKNTFFFWSCAKKADDYTKQVIEITFIADTKDVAVEKDEDVQTMQEGNVEISLNAFITKDIEDEWAIRKKSAVRRFIRELYDKFANKGKYDVFEGKLEKDREAIAHDLKTYLRMRRFD